MLSGFKQFILRGNVVDMAVGVVIGAAFGGVVKALTDDLLMPFIAAIVGKPDFSAIHFTINGSAFPVGLFINALVAFCLGGRSRLFLCRNPVNALIAGCARPSSGRSDTKKCPECLSEIPIDARRCAHSRSR